VLRGLGPCPGGQAAGVASKGRLTGPAVSVASGGRRKECGWTQFRTRAVTARRVEGRRHLLEEHDLDASAVVANNAMNRERGITGTNSYAKGLGFDLLSFLDEKLENQAEVSWLDLCCGTGKALVEAAQHFQTRGLGQLLSIRGVDLVAFFASVPSGLPSLRLEVASLRQFEPEERYDLITCVHGLHYVGDKLGVIARACGWLKPAGMLLANLDLKNMRLTQGSAARRVPKALRDAGIDYDRRKRVVSCRGPRTVAFPFTYHGADDQAGPNYTGQPAVDSYYDPKQ